MPINKQAKEMSDFMLNKMKWIKVKELGLEFRNLGKMKYADINLQKGEQLIKYWQFVYLCENLKTKLEINLYDEYWLTKTKYYRACWLYDFNNNSVFYAYNKGVGNDDVSLRGVIVCKK